MRLHRSAGAFTASVPEVPRRMPECGRQRNAIPPTRAFPPTQCTLRRTGRTRGRTSCTPMISSAAPATGPAGRLVRSCAGSAAIFGQLRRVGGQLPRGPANTSATCGSTMRGDAEGVFRGPSDKRRTSHGARGVKRFVIECFTPRCLVDLASDGELVTNAPPDTVDLIMGGLTGDYVQNREDDASIRGGLELHEPGVQFRNGDGHSVASTIGIASRHP